MRAVRALALALVIGCGGGNGGGGGGDDTTAPDAPTVPVGMDTTVVAFDGEHVYFGGKPNRRTVDKAVTFPAPDLRYSRVTLDLGLRCPTGGCDWWDRLGHISLVQGTGDDATEIELARFITPYRVGGQFTVDVTDLQRLLEGPQTVRVFIDTWVNPGHANGAGWLVDASFEFVGGVPTPDPVAVIPLWAPQRVVYGDPMRPVDVTATPTLPDGLTGARVRALVTGHGQGNAENCAEFCAKDHTIAVDAETITTHLWRDDCPTTAVPNQQGTWRYPRAGWCPGAMVTPWVGDVAGTAGPRAISYQVQTYENTCRPDATTCGGCTLGTGCSYDGGAHTEPGWEQSAVLVLLQ
jgi:hypothetical protein